MRRAFSRPIRAAVGGRCANTSSSATIQVIAAWDALQPNYGPPKGGTPSLHELVSPVPGGGGLLCTIECSSWTGIQGVIRLTRAGGGEGGYSVTVTVFCVTVTEYCKQTLDRCL